VKTRHFAQLFALSALWGASFLFIRIASPVLGPLVMAEIRVALASLVLWIAMRAAGESIQRRWWRELFIVGALSVALPFALFSWAGLHLPAGYMALLNVSAVLFGTLFAAWLREDTLTARKLLGCVCGFAGVGMVVQLGPVQLSGCTCASCGTCRRSRLISPAFMIPLFGVTWGHLVLGEPLGTGLWPGVRWCCWPPRW
jgi:drug/metabolite transporter (DMT)-like permease